MLILPALIITLSGISGAGGIALSVKSVVDSMQASSTNRYVQERNERNLLRFEAVSRELDEAMQELGEQRMVIAKNFSVFIKAYEQIHSYLIGNIPEGECAIAGFILENTLSENGGVTRGVCEVNGNTLTKITETKNIVKTKDGAQSGDLVIDPKSYVSMNFWGFDLSFMDKLEEGFKSFLSKEENLSGEFLIPVYVGELLKEGKMSVKILPTEDKWFGVTYKEDKAAVCKSFDELIKNGVYSKELYSDI